MSMSKGIVVALAALSVGTAARADVLYEINFSTSLSMLDLSIDYDATKSEWLVDPTAIPYQWIPDSPTSFSTSSDNFELWYGPLPQCTGPSEYSCSGSSWANDELVWTQTSSTTWALNAADSFASSTPNVTGGGNCVPNPPATTFSCEGSMVEVSTAVPTPDPRWLMLGSLALLGLRRVRGRFRPAPLAHP